MIDHDPRSGAGYAAPTLDEMLQLAESVGLLEGFAPSPRGIQMRLAGQLFVLPQRDAELLLQGALLGYFSAPGEAANTGMAWE